MTHRLGYLVPEFPGQTHIFFWREIQALAELGVEAGLISTRKPRAELISHSWALDAMGRTEYLAPPRVRLLLGGCAVLFLAGPAGWLRCLRAVAWGDGSLYARLCRLPLLLAGAQVAWLAARRGWVHVHAHSCGKSADCVLFAHLLTGLPYSLTLHGPLKDYGDNQGQKWQSAAFAIVITQGLRDEVRRELAEHAPARIEIAPMGVDPRQFQRSTPYAACGGEGRRIFSCGRLNPCKGHDDLIRSVAVLREAGIPVELRIAGQDDSGTGQYREYLVRLAEELSVADRVHLLGAVSEGVVRCELEHAHLFALASLHEPLGVAIMEAMAMETPVVVTRGGGVPELVDDGVDGLLAEPRDPRGLAEQMRRIFDEPALARRLGTAGREKIQRAFHSGVSAGVLAALLAGPTPATHPPAGLDGP